MYYTYLIQSKKDNQWYTGCTSDLRNRLKEHNDGKVYATKNRGPFQIVYYEACHNKQDAFVREKYLKSGMGKRYLKNRLRRFLSLTGLVFMLFMIYPAMTHAAVLSRAPNNLGLVGYWPMNEGVGTKAGDSSGNGNTGTLTLMADPPTATSGWNPGKHGKALAFDGSDEYVDVGIISLADNTSWSVSMWIKPKVLSNYRGLYGNQFTVGNYTRFFFGISEIYLYNDANNLVNWTKILSVNTWQHIAVVCDGSNSNNIQLYINGVAQGLKTLTDSSQVIRKIGNYGSGGTINGLIDDVRIYNRALTASEVAALYQSGAVRLKAPNNLGLVGYWSFNEGVGTKAGDSSGNGNTGTWNGTGSHWTDGKRGKAGNFNGSNDYVDMAGSTGVSLGANFTLSAWVKNSVADLSATEWFVSKYKSSTNKREWILGVGGNAGGGGVDNKIYFYGSDDGTANAGHLMDVHTAAIPNWNQWKHIVCVISGSSSKIYINGVNMAVTIDTPLTSFYASGEPIRIGGKGDLPNFWSGLIDDVRVYNRALSATEILALYQSGAVKVNVSQNTRLTSGLVGLWSFNGPDYNSASTTAEVLDRSGQGNNGDNIGAVPTIGKIGQALKFDGGNDYVNVGASNGLFPSSSSWSFSLWFNADTIGAGSLANRILDPLRASGSSMMFVGTGSSNKLQFWENSQTNNIKIISTGIWYFVAVSYDSTTYKVYVNNDAPVSIIDSCYTASSDPLGIGALAASTPSNFFDGLIDEVRIYNRALSASEVKQLYNMGK